MLLEQAEETARTVMAEARRILALLTPDEEEQHSGPLPDLGSLTELARRHTAAGLEVSVRAATATQVRPGPALLAHRLVEEALAAAHDCGAGTAEVAVDDLDDALHVVVTHDGTSSGLRPERFDRLRERAGLCR